MEATIGGERREGRAMPFGPALPPLRGSAVPASCQHGIAIAGVCDA